MSLFYIITKPIEWAFDAISEAIKLSIINMKQSAPLLAESVAAIAAKPVTRTITHLVTETVTINHPSPTLPTLTTGRLTGDTPAPPKGMVLFVRSLAVIGWCLIYGIIVHWTWLVLVKPAFEENKSRTKKRTDDVAHQPHHENREHIKDVEKQQFQPGTTNDDTGAGAKPHNNEPTIGTGLILPPFFMPELKPIERRPRTAKKAASTYSRIKTMIDIEPRLPQIPTRTATKGGVDLAEGCAPPPSEIQKPDLSKRQELKAQKAIAIHGQMPLPATPPVRPRDFNRHTLRKRGKKSEKAMMKAAYVLTNSTIYPNTTESITNDADIKQTPVQDSSTKEPTIEVEAEQVKTEETYIQEQHTQDTATTQVVAANEQEVDENSREAGVIDMRHAEI